MKSDVELFCVYDPNYSSGLMAALSSLHIVSNGTFEVRILVAQKDLFNLFKALDTLRRYSPAIINISVAIIPKSILTRCEKLKFRHHFTPTICYRIFYFDIVSSFARYVIYFDLDMIWRKSPRELISLLVNKFPIAAVRQQMPESSKTIDSHNKLLGTYFNSGLIVFDTERIDEINFALSEADRSLEELAKTSDFLDQDALNFAFASRWQPLPSLWNYDTQRAQQESSQSYLQFAGILHATGSEKPWHIPNSHVFSNNFETIFRTVGVPMRYLYSFRDSWRRIIRRLAK